MWKLDSAGLLSGHNRSLCYALTELITTCTTGISLVVVKNTTCPISSYISSLLSHEEVSPGKRQLTTDVREDYTEMTPSVVVALAIDLKFRSDS